jgi:hypothetical protein
MNGDLESQEFYELCQTYRNSVWQIDVTAAYEALKLWIRTQSSPSSPSYGDWLKLLSMAQLTAGIIETLEEIQSRGLEPTVIWTGVQWAVGTRDKWSV